MNTLNSLSKKSGAKQCPPAGYVRAKPRLWVNALPI
jgi:hypothetical protein